MQLHTRPHIPQPSTPHLRMFPFDRIEQPVRYLSQLRVSHRMNSRSSLRMCQQFDLKVLGMLNLINTSQATSVVSYAHKNVVLSVCLSVCLSIRLSVCLSVCPSVCLSVCPSICLSVCLSIRLSVCQSFFCWLSLRVVMCC